MGPGAAHGPTRLEAVSVVLLILALGGILSVVPVAATSPPSSGTGAGACAGSAAFPAGSFGNVGAAVAPLATGVRPASGNGAPGGGSGTAPYFFDLRVFGTGVYAGHAAYVFWIDFAALNVTAGDLQFSVASPNATGFAVELGDANGSAIGVYDSARSPYGTGVNATALGSAGWVCGASTLLTIGETVSLFAPTDISGGTLQVAAAEPAASGSTETTLSFALGA